MTQKIQYVRAGAESLSARWLNRIVDGANIAIGAVAPPRSTRLPESSSLPAALNESDDGEIVASGTRIYNETDRLSSTVRISDPASGSYVDVDRIDRVTLESDDDLITLIFDND